MANKPLELTGKTIWHLHVIERAGSTPTGAKLWRCHCDLCGNDAIIEARRLNGARAKKDCGCAYKAKKADLSGKTYGPLTVLKRVGTDKGGNSTYLCRCSVCGGEKVLPACSIRAIPKSCGCAEHNSERMKRISAIAAAQYNGVNKSSLFRKEANKNSQTGIRGVFPDSDYPHLYRAAVQVHGELVIKTGFTTIESAKRERDRIYNELIEKYGIEDPTSEKPETT